MDRRPSPGDTGWYAISSDCSREEFLAVAKTYARAVVDEHGLSVSVGDLDWAVSTRARRRAGAVRHRDGEPEVVVLTWGQFETNGWDATAGTIRHELAHVHLLNEAGDPGHGPAFRRLADRLDAPLHCERFSDPRWWVVCAACGNRIARYRRSKLVTHVGEYECGECGGDLRVEENETESGGAESDRVE